jgi:O-antigen/teichoic acid export membrane protein
MNRTFKDVIWYSSGTFLPALISFISVPIMTRYFTPEEYGVNSIIDTTFNYANTIFFAILSSSIWRFYNQFKRENKIIYFKKILFKVFVISVSILLIFVLIVCFFAINNNYLKLLVYGKFVAVVLSAYISIFSVILRLEGKSISYNVILIYSALSSFLVLLFLTQKLHIRNIALYISMIIPQSVVFVLFLIKNRTKGTNIPVETDEEKKDIVRIVKYGIISVTAIFSQSLLATSDRYILKIFKNIADVGIYDRTYAISDRIIYIFVTLFFNIFTPSIYKALESKNTDVFFKKTMPLFLLVVIPLFVYFTLFSKMIVLILLGEKFQTGYIIIPFICAGTVFMAFSQFAEMKLRFQNPKTVLVGYSIANICNILLNLFFIPLYGVLGAAITTTISYIVLFVFLSWKASLLHIGFYIFKTKANYLYLLLLIQIILFFIINQHLILSLFFTIIEGLSFGLIYILSVIFLIHRKIILLPDR